MTSKTRSYTLGWTVILALGLGLISTAPCSRAVAQDKEPAPPLVPLLRGTPDPPKEPVDAEKGEPDPNAPPKPLGPAEPDLVHMVSQLMMVTLEGKLRPSTSDVDMLTKFTPGAVLVQNISSPTIAADFVLALRSLPLEQTLRIPLLIGTDMYTARPLPTIDGRSLTELPPLLSLAAVNDVAIVERFSEMLADQLFAMGFNFHMGPALVLSPNLADAPGTVHCFGSDPEYTATLGNAMISTLAARGIIPVPLGFPGGGANRTEREPAVLLTPKSTLAQEDVLPFAQAIKNGARIVHTGTTLIPTIDPAGPPACISPAVMRGLLRETLAFDGIVLAGPMDTIEIAGRMDQTEAAIRAIEAGADMIWWNKSDQRILNTIQAIALAVQNGRMAETTIRDAYARVLALKQELGLLERPLPDPNQAAKMVKDKSQPKLVEEVFRRSITLVKNHGDFLPLNRDTSPPVGITGTVAGIEELMDVLQKEKIKPIQRQKIVSAKYDGQIHDFDINRILTRFKGARTVVCVFTSTDRPATVSEVIARLKGQGAGVVAVLLGYPSMLPHLAKADAILLVYCSPGEFLQNIDAVSDILIGNAPISVKPVTRELKTAAGKIELYRAIDVVHSPTGRLPVAVGDAFPAGASGEYDVTSFLKRAEWDFGDGKKTKGLEVERAYAAAGTYDVTLTITTVNGDIATGGFQVIVE